MWSALSKWIDRAVIRQASAGLPYGKGFERLQEAAELLTCADFFCGFAEKPAKVEFTGAREFRFPSAITTPWPQNNLVHGQLFRSSRDWQRKPTVILLHGWNGETGYRLQFPMLAWRLCRSGVNTALIELPYHAQRKPQTPGALQNFISHDLLRMLEATRQAIADTRTLAGWLLAQGSPSVGLAGFSLGAWLTGLIASHDARIQFAALITPVVKLERAIAELPFCAPIRESLVNNALGLEPLNLASHIPLTPRENILLIESQHDLFAPAETIEEVWQTWGQPEIWRVPLGHISVLMALPIMERLVRWLVRKAQKQTQTSASPAPACARDIAVGIRK